MQDESCSDALCCAVAPVKGGLALGLATGQLLVLNLPRDTAPSHTVTAHAAGVVAVR